MVRRSHSGYVTLREARRRAGPVPDDFSREFEAMFKDETILPFETTAFRAWCLLSAVQLASRHPEAMKTVPMQIAVGMARQIQMLVATTPALARVAEQGWDQTQDA